MSSDYIDDRLHLWARWALRRDGPQGYNPETVLYRIARDGALIRGTGARPEPEAVQEEETDKAVTALKERRPEVWAVLVKHYLDRGTTVQKCKDLAISRRTFVDRLAAARDWVDAYLTALAY